MRVAWLVVVLCLSACAGEKLAFLPPTGVDLSGHWQLNEADSDDPQRLVLSQLAAPASGAAGPGGQGGGGQGGRGGRQGGRGGGGGGFGGIAGGPSMPAPGALSDGLRWPGKVLEIKQVAGAVAMTSSGISRVYQPTSADRRAHRPRRGPESDGAPQRDMPVRDRGEGPPSVCGWEDRTLVVKSDDPEDDHPPFEQRYSVSDDGQRLVEVVGFKGGRSSGFTMSRVWDRVIANAPSTPAAGVPPLGPTSGPTSAR